MNSLFHNSNYLRAINSSTDSITYFTRSNMKIQRKTQFAVFFCCFTFVYFYWNFVLQAHTSSILIKYGKKQTNTNRSKKFDCYILVNGSVYILIYCYTQPFNHFCSLKISPKEETKNTTTIINANRKRNYESNGTNENEYEY